MKPGNYKVFYTIGNSPITMTYTRASSPKQAIEIAETWPAINVVVHGVLSPESQEYIERAFK